MGNIARLASAFGAIGIVGTAGVTSVDAQTAAACETFTVSSDGSARVVDYVDLAAPGPTPGDMRVGQRDLIDADGAEAGTYRWLLTQLPGDKLHGQMIFELPGGQLFAERLADAVRPTDDVGQVSISGHTAVITGGNGVFDDAHGTVTVVFDGIGATYRVNVRCG
ncbi:MAG: hypothetical protein AAFX81_16180 [Pseudomonadota bacterium]